MNREGFRGGKKTLESQGGWVVVSEDRSIVVVDSLGFRLDDGLWIPNNEVGDDGWGVGDREQMLVRQQEWWWEAMRCGGRWLGEYATRSSQMGWASRTLKEFGMGHREL